MTTTTYKYGKHTCKGYKKACGNGWEVGFMFGDHTIFVGNFIHAKECNLWWGKMNMEIRRFSKRYALPKNASPQFFMKFMTSHLYKCYYNFLSTQFTKYTRTFTTNCKKMDRKFSAQKRHWPNHVERATLRRAG